MDDIPNYIDGTWTKPNSNEFVDVVNPALCMTLGRDALSGPAKVVFARWPKDRSRKF